MRDRRITTLLFCAATLVAGAAHAQDLRTDEMREEEPQLPSGGAPPLARSGLFSEPKLLADAINEGFVRFGETGTPANGPYLELSNMITGSGWVSIGPGYRRQIFSGSAFVDISAAVSWRLYNMVQGRFEMPDLMNRHASVGVQTMWQDQTQIDYYGIGAHSLATNESEYRMQSIDTVAYATIQPVSALTFGGEVGFLRRPDILSPGGTFKSGVPTTPALFSLDPGVAAPFQPNFVHDEISITSDTRDHRSRPTRGGLYRTALTSFTDNSGGTFTFKEYEAEGAQFIPLSSTGWVLALHGWVVESDVARGHEIPFYLLPTLGGNNTLRSYVDYRFHDRNLALVNAESRFPIFTHVDGAVFLDAGNVAPRFQDLNLNKTSIGAGVRLHTERATFARLDVAHGTEGWQVTFRTSDPLRLSRLTRRVAAVPFVP